jgi:ABC-type nickel/cobalt efflux system permease component RcnA
MRRLIAFLLISLIGFQTSWATVTSYCQHEQGIGARHLGHHEHQHDHPSLIKADGQDDQQINHLNTQQNLASASVDLDCGLCHAACIVALLPDSTPAITTQVTLDLSYALTLHPPSAPNDLPERPNWS